MIDANSLIDVDYMSNNAAHVVDATTADLRFCQRRDQPVDSFSVIDR